MRVRRLALMRLTSLIAMGVVMGFVHALPSDRPEVRGMFVGAAGVLVMDLVDGAFKRAWARYDRTHNF